MALNVGLLGLIAWIAVSGARSDQPLSMQGVIVAAKDKTTTTDPLDQLSAADIATNAALATNLPEKTAIINQADSAQAEQTISPADTVVVAKAQTVATPFKSRKDIKQYVVQKGDTVSSIAAKFNVTSDSIIWSNNLNGNYVNPGQLLWIPPDGVSGIVYTVQNGDTVASLADKYRVSADQIIAFNDIELTGLKTGERILIPHGTQPVQTFSLAAATATYGFNGYDFGFCTWYVANRRIEIGRPLPANLGNASTWDYRAAAMGLSVDKNPSVGAARISSHIGAGHVQFVEAMNADGSIWVSEMNSYGQVSMTNATPHGGWDIVDWKLIPASEVHLTNYIH